MNDVKIVYRRTESLIPYENNPRNNDEAVKYVANSIEQFGFKVPIVIDTDGVIVAGHTRWQASRELGLEKVPCIVADDLSEEQVKAFRLADNKVSEYSSWDWELLDSELAELDFDMSNFGFGGLEDNIEQTEEAESKYTTKVKVPQYEVTGEKPTFSEMLDETKAKELIAEIQGMEGITREEKHFLIEAAKRHNAFNYKSIAEYYAQASPEFQALAERSALVIIDFDDAIANGFVKLEDRIMEQIDDE